MIDFNKVLDSEAFESAVGKPVDIVGKNLEELLECYETLFIGAYMLTQPKSANPEAKPGYVSAIEWLRTTDFYRAPASTRYHESFPGGLLTHSLNVYNCMLELHSVPKFNSINIAEATLVTLVHDWCKIDYYEPYQKNVKDEKTGKWHSETAYRAEQRGIPMGHGSSSMYLASRVMRLTPEQALAIRWHMSRWHVADVEQSELQKANEKFPMVHLIQFADQLAVTNY